MTTRTSSSSTALWEDVDDALARSRYADTEQWESSVIDGGVGIDPADADRIFEVFQRLEGGEEGGSGIGLAPCKRIVERHEGDIWVASVPGEGPTVSFTLAPVGDHDE
jgi:signal transduction histidine kinase